MLGKLIKYDMKSMSRFLVPVHIFLIAAAFLTRFLAMPGLFADDQKPNFMSVMIVIGFFITVVGVSLSTFFVIAVRFYRHLFSDEGYLTLTLPVTPSQHLAAKTISGVIWTLVSLFLIYASCLFVVLVPQVTDLIAKEGLTLSKAVELAFGMNPGTLIGYMAVLSVLGAVSSVALLYFCVTIGQLFANHRALAAVIVYFVIVTLMQIVLTIGLLFFSVIPHFGESIEPGTTAYVAYMTSTFNVSIVSCVAQGIISYIGSNFIMNRKINLI